MVMAMGDQAQISAVRFGSQARRAGWEQGWDVAEVKVPNAARPSEFLVYIPSLLILVLVLSSQGVSLLRSVLPVASSSFLAHLKKAVCPLPFLLFCLHASCFFILSSVIFVLFLFFFFFFHFT